MSANAQAEKDLATIDEATQVLSYMTKNGVDEATAKEAVARQIANAAFAKWQGEAYRDLTPQPIETVPAPILSSLDIQNLLSIQAFQLEKGDQPGRYAKNKTHTPPLDNQPINVVDYRLPVELEKQLPQFLQNQIQELDLKLNQKESPGTVDEVNSPEFNPLTLTLCEVNPVFKTNFAGFYQTNQNERAAFIEAFRAANISFSAEDDFIKKIQTHAAKKSDQVKINGDLIPSPKKIFLGALINALTASADQKTKTAGDLFDAGSQPRLRKNTGFWGWLRNLLGKPTKTMGFATAFFTQTQSRVNPLTQLPRAEVVAAQ